MAEIVAKLGIRRDPSFMYFIRRGAVWRIRRPAQDHEPEKLVDITAPLDATYVHYLDRDGNVARMRRRNK